MLVREAVEAEVRKLAIHSVTVLGRYSALRPSTSPGFVSPTALVHFVRNLRDGAHRHKLTEQVPTGVFPQLAWQPAAVARSALLIHAPTDATAALVRRAKHCQQTWPDALSQRPTSTDSILSRNVDERTASESLSNTQRPLGLHRAQPVPAPGSNPSQDRQEDHYLGRCQQIAVRHGRRLQRGAAGCLGAVRSQGAAGPTAPGAAHRANPQGCHGRRCSFYNHQKCYSSTPNSAVLQTMANS